LQAAQAYKEASSKTEQKKFFDAKGVRWSELLRLPYWDPTKFVVVDGMHNLFLGLVQFHMRKVLGMNLLGNIGEDDNSLREATPEEMTKARNIWAKGVKSKNQLKRVNMPALQGLCLENEIAVKKLAGQQKLKRCDLVAALVAASLKVSISIYAPFFDFGTHLQTGGCTKTNTGSKPRYIHRRTATRFD
jgi:hypothetical protein